MATKLAVYNAALLAIGERKLNSLSENREPRRALDDVWDAGFVVECLEAGLWNFAIRTAEVAPDPDYTPQFGFTYAFTKPDDCVRVAALCSDEFLKTPLLEYRDEAGFWFASIDPIYVSYVSSDAEYGGALARWPQKFTRFVEHKLAERVSLRLTGDKQRLAAAKQLAKEYLTEAKSTDAMDNPTQMLPPGSWSRARAGRRSRLDRGNRGSLIG